MCGYTKSRLSVEDDVSFFLTLYEVLGYILIDWGFWFTNIILSIMHHKTESLNPRPQNISKISESIKIISIVFKILIEVHWTSSNILIKEVLY